MADIIRTTVATPIFKAQSLSGSQAEVLTSKLMQTLNADVAYYILLYVGVELKDLTWLWATCREVSRPFKDAVERVFITKHLKRTSLSTNLGERSTSGCFHNLANSASHSHSR